MMQTRQELLSKINSWIFIRNYEGYKAVRWYSQSAEGGGMGGWGTVYQEFYTQKIILYAAFKNKGKIKTFPDKEELRVCHWADLTYQKYQGSSSGWNENLLCRNLNAHEEIRMCKGKYIGKYKRQNKLIFGTLLLSSSKDNCMEV